MIEIKGYSESFRDEWNKFLATCKNRHFMFHRDYMEYHGSRYIEYSKLFFNKNKLIAILPANLTGAVVTSHGWLSFGGVLYDNRMTVSLMLDIFDRLMDILCNEGIEQFIYKAIPHIYHQSPAEEDLYALFRNKACLIRRDVSAAIELRKMPIFTERKKRYIKKAEKLDGLRIEESDAIGNFWELLTEHLNEKYETRPVHSLDEIQLLMSRFPDNIKLFGVIFNESLIGGTLIYENEGTIHTQYIVSNNICREIGGLDALFNFLITKHYVDRKIFDFGISNEQEGWFLNEGLISFKEGFGARSIIHDFYRVDIDR